MLLKLKLKIIIPCISLFIINTTKIIKIDNLISEISYQDNLKFSLYETKFKILAIFYLDNYINNNNKIVYKKEFQLLKNKKEEIKILRILIKKQVELAKNHGIFGFGIVYNLVKEQKFNEEIINYFLGNMDNFPFFIIFDNKDYKQNNSSFLFRNKIFNDNSFFFSFKKFKNI